MKKLILFLLLCFPVLSYAEFSSHQLDTFGGFVDILEADILGEKYSPDCLNVLTDEFGVISKRRGYTPYLTSPLSELQPFRSMYAYGQQGGGSFLIYESSSSVYYSPGDGTSNAIIQARDTGYRHTYAILKDFLYGSNGSQDLWRSSCSASGVYTEFTVANSTNMVKARYICSYYNKMFYAGVDGARSTVYWSKYLVPLNINAFNYVNINAQDGDIITGMFVTSDNKMKVFKTYSTWELYPTGVDSSGETNFDFRNLSMSIGCLYQQTIDELNGYVAFVSARGVEQYDGAFNLISQPIDNFIKTLNQFKITQGTLIYDTAPDWGNGSGVNIDTTTTSGSVIMPSTWSYTSTNIVNSYIWTRYLRQSFLTSSQNDLLSIEISNIDTRSLSDFARCSVYDNTYTLIKTTTIAKVNQSWIIDLSTITITKSSTYYFTITAVGTPVFAWPEVYVGVDNFYPYGKCQYSPDNSTWTDGYYTFSSSSDTALSDINFFLTYSESATYTTAISTATNFTSWGTVTINDSKPTGSSISYYVQTSTANDNRVTRPYYPISNGGVVPTTVGGYIWITSSFTRTSATAEPLINSYRINYYSSGANPPCAKVFDNRYWLFVSTDASNPINNVVLCYQKTGEWTVFNNIYAGATTIFRNNFYTGSSQNTGKIYRQDVPDIYNDDGGAYNSYWCSKVFDFGVFANFKTFDSFWVSAKNSGNYNLNVSYRLDGTDMAWTDKSILLTNGYGYIVSKTPFALLEPREGRFLQYKVWNNNANEPFYFKKIQSVFTIQNPL